MTGTYQWNASYSGDGNNNAASDNNAANEQVTVSAGQPDDHHDPEPDHGHAGDVAGDADRHGGPGGRLSTRPARSPSRCVYGGATVDTETVTVSGNGTYTTPTGYTLPTTGTVTGTYQWDATYSGDGNNNAASDNSDANEQVTVSPASPTITTTPARTTVTLGTSAVTLTDTAVLAGGYQPDRHDHLHAGLQRAARTVDTETVTVSGNGTYTTPTGYTLPTTGTVTGTYQWNATLQRRRQQQRRQRHRRRQRAGGGQPGQPDDHHHAERDHGRRWARRR